MTNDVMHATLRYPPALGGVETYVRDIVSAFPNSHSVVCSDLADHLSWGRLSPQQIGARPSNVTTVKTRRLRGAPGYPWLVDLRGSLARSTGIVHGHAMYYATFDVPLATLAPNRPMVLSPFAYRRAGRKQAMYLSLLNAAIRRADRLVFITDYERTLTRQLIPRSAAVEDAIVPPLVRAGPVRDADPDLVVSVGRHDIGKGARDLPALAAHLSARRPGTRLQVLGARSSETDWLLACARESHGSLEVSVNATDGAIAEAVSRATAFVTASRYEAFGIAAVEAASVGVPVAAYDVGALPTVLEPQDVALAERFDVQRLAGAVLGLLDRNETLAHRQSRAGSYLDRYGADRWRDQWTSIYDSLS